jgi:hypothetical protein
MPERLEVLYATHSRTGDVSRWEGFETLAECIQDFITFRKKEMKGIVK